MQIVEFESFQYYTDDPVYQHSISHGYTEPYPIHLDIVKRYLRMFPHKNKTYIDIGAHIGTTIIPYSGFFENIIGYEANPNTYELLIKNVKLNSLNHVKIYNFGIFNEECRGQVLQHNGRNSGCYYFVKKENGPVLCKTLDVECKRKKIDNIDFIKIDTEGCEYFILESGRETIIKNKPFIQFAMNFRSTELFHIDNKNSIDFLLDLGYIIFDNSDTSNIFMYCPNETLSIFSKTIYTFWTGTNEMSIQRHNSLHQLREVSQSNVVLIHLGNINDYILQTEPLHPAYEYLSETHKADYLRTYFMHFYGGGYSDIKQTTGSWIHCFYIMMNTEKLACGYAEIEGGPAVPELREEWQKLIGNGAYIFKPNTKFTKKWYDTMIYLLDEKYEELKEHPATNPQDRRENGSGYPIEWNEMLGRIVHKINYEYHTEVLNILPISIFYNYR